MTVKVIITVPLSQLNGVTVEAIGSRSEDPIATETVMPGEQKGMYVGDSVVLNITDLKK